MQGKVVMSMADQFTRLGRSLPRPVQVRHSLCSAMPVVRTQPHVIHGGYIFALFHRACQDLFVLDLWQL